jgi:hypothetical protein
MVSALSSINSGIGGLHRDVLELQSQINELQRQLATGKKSETYGGLGTDRLLVLSLHERVTTINSFTRTIDRAQIQLDVVQIHLERVREIAAVTRTDTFLPDYTTLSNGQTSGQISASAHLNETLALLNSDVAGRHVFSGRTTDVDPVVNSDVLLNGDGTGAGFRQIMTERKLADLGAGGLGRLTVSNSSPTVTLAEDAAGHPFGVKLSGVSSTLTGTSVVGPAAAAAAVTGTVDLGVDVAAVNIGTGQSFVGTETLQSLGFSNGETITITTDGGTTTHTIVDATTEDVDAVMATLTGNSEAGVVLNAGNLEATASNNVTSVTFGGTGDVTQLGLTTNTVEPSNATVDALTGTATLEIGTQGALTLDFDGAITNRAQLESALSGLAGGTATVNGSNFIQVTAGNNTDPITIGGTADTGLGLPDEGVVNPTPPAATVTGSVDLGVDVAAANAGTGQSFVGTESLQSLGFSNGETITITTDAGITTHTIVDATTEDVDAVIATLTGNAETGVALSGGNLVATGSNNVTSITFGGTGDVSQLGLTTTTVEPTNATIDALTGTATLQVGSQTQLTLDFDSAITNRAQLEAALGGLAGGTATVNGSNFIEVTAGNNSDPITIGGTADTGLGLPDDGIVNATSAAIDITFSATLPQPGQSVRATFTLPDGSQEIFELTATASSPPGAGEFLIGVDENDTATNFEAALNTALQTFGASTLASASTVAAANDFFFYDSANPPQRIDGPPFDTAVALRDGTSADTIFWYKGDNEPGPARNSAIAHVDDNLNIAYGTRANEEPLAMVISKLAVLAGETFDGTVADDEARYFALTDRVATDLNFNNKVSVDDLVTELGFKQRTLPDAHDRHSATQQVSLSLLQEREGTDDYEVSAKILRLQTQIAASFETTSLLSQLSLVNFI